MENKIYIIFTLLILIIRQIYIEYLNNNNKTECNYYHYIILFILIYVLTYNLTKNYSLSLFSSFIIFYGRTIYRYNFNIKEIQKKDNINNLILFIVGLYFPLLIYYFKNILLKSKLIELFNFIFIVYGFFSILEYYIHKYVMHCNKNSNNYKLIKNIPIIGNYYEDTCKVHINHHLKVDKNMDINHIDEKPGLFMSWGVFIVLLPIVFITIKLSSIISNYKVSNIILFVITVLTIILWEYIWNKTHVKMHNLEIKYNILKGPYDGGLFDLGGITRLLNNNHKNHHLQKGDKKGNYNVILLGADEWFCKNNQTIDNNEYCKKNKNDKVCL